MYLQLSRKVNVHARSTRALVTYSRLAVSEYKRRNAKTPLDCGDASGSGFIGTIPTNRALFYKWRNSTTFDLIISNISPGVYIG